MNLVLMGYMGSGKSSVGKKLAKVLGCDFIDLDEYIETKENQTVKEIFRLKGELFFRKKEHLYLKELLLKDNVIISLGGGTPCYNNNMQLLSKHKNLKTIYLKVVIPELTKRLFIEKEQRPLISHIKTKEFLTEFIGKHLFERTQFYNKADYIIDANIPVNKIIQNIVFKLF